ncbi:MAG: pseudouridine synthase [Patescibacteria group bacterium]
MKMENSSTSESTNRPGIRLQKRIADLGFCSRRKAEFYIEEGKVEVNGEVVTTLGTKVNLRDRISVMGEELSEKKKDITIMLHKPAGYLCSRFDPHHEKTVYTLLPEEFHHLKPAGRLDLNSEGLLILSSNGELIQELTHPSFEHKKTYLVLVKGIPKKEDLKLLEKGELRLDEKKLAPMKFEILEQPREEQTWIKLTLGEGRKRQIRRVMETLGFPVLYLKRTAIGRLELGDLKHGHYKILEEADIKLAQS